MINKFTKNVKKIISTIISLNVIICAQYCTQVISTVFIKNETRFGNNAQNSGLDENDVLFSSNLPLGGLSQICAGDKFLGV